MCDFFVPHGYTFVKKITSSTINIEINNLFLSFFFVKTEYSKLAFDTNSEFLNAESLKHNVSGKVEHETYPECFKDLKGNVD